MTTDYEPRPTPPAQPAPPAPLPDEPYYRRPEQARRIGALLLLVGVVWLVFALAARGPLFSLGFVERSAPIPAQSFAVERVVIAGVNDEITLVAADGDAVRLSGQKYASSWSGGSADGALGQLELVVEERGGTLRVELRRPNISAIGGAPYAELRVEVPAGVAVEAEVVNGEIVAAGLRGDVRLATVSGDIDSEDSVGALEVTTTSGDVSFSDHSGPFVADSTSGDVYADGALDSPRVTTVSGDVELAGVRGAAELRSISGDLSLSDGEDVSLMLESTSGDIEFAGALARGVESSIANISGDVRVALDDDDVRVEISGAGGDDATLGEGSTLLRISNTAGDVEVERN